MKKKSCNICLIVIFVIYVVLLIVGNVGRESVSVVVARDSYADIFAEKNHLHKVEITDDLRDKLDVRYTADDIEVFRANLKDEKGNYIEVTKGNVTIRIYDDGTITDGSEEIDINPTTVTTVTEKTIETDKIYVIQPGDTLGEISDATGVGIYEIAEKNNIEDISLIYSNVELKIPSKQHIAEITTQTTNAKEGVETESKESFNYVASSMSECEFGYNIVNSTVELVYYYGSEKELIIPSYIGGFPVTTIKFDLVGNFDSIVIPKTVTAITGKVSKIIYTPVFFIEMIFSLIAFFLVAIAVNILLPRLEKEEECVLTGPQLILSSLYLVAQLVFSVLVIYYYVSATPFIAAVISSVMVGVYIVTLLMAGAGRQHAINEERSTKVKTSVMKQIKLECESLTENITNEDVKALVKEFVSEVRYSPLGSSMELVDIEDELMEAVEKLSGAVISGNEDEIKECCVTAKKILKKRNRLAKATV